MMVALEANPLLSLLALYLALPSSVFGPVDCCAFILLAAICLDVAIVGFPFLAGSSPNATLFSKETPLKKRRTG